MVWTLTYYGIDIKMDGIPVRLITLMISCWEIFTKIIKTNKHIRRNKKSVNNKIDGKYFAFDQTTD